MDFAPVNKLKSFNKERSLGAPSLAAEVAHTPRSSASGGSRAPIVFTTSLKRKTRPGRKSHASSSGFRSPCGDGGSPYEASVLDGDDSGRWRGGEKEDDHKAGVSKRKLFLSYPQVYDAISSTAAPSVKIEQTLHQHQQPEPSDDTNTYSSADYLYGDGDDGTEAGAKDDDEDFPYLFRNRVGGGVQNSSNNDTGTRIGGEGGESPRPKRRRRTTAPHQEDWGDMESSPPPLSSNKNRRQLLEEVLGTRRQRKSPSKLSNEFPYIESKIPGFIMSDMEVPGLEGQSVVFSKMPDTANSKRQRQQQQSSKRTIPFQEIIDRFEPPDLVDSSCDEAELGSGTKGTKGTKGTGGVTPTIPKMTCRSNGRADSLEPHKKEKKRRKPIMIPGLAQPPPPPPPRNTTTKTPTASPTTDPFVSPVLLPSPLQSLFTSPEEGGGGTIAPIHRPATIPNSPPARKTPSVAATAGDAFSLLSRNHHKQEIPITPTIECFGCMYGNQVSESDLAPELSVIHQMFDQNYGKVKNTSLCRAIHKYFSENIYTPAIKMRIQIPTWSARQIHDHFFNHIIHPRIHIGEKIRMFITLQKVILQSIFFSEDDNDQDPTPPNHHHQNRGNAIDGEPTDPSSSSGQEREEIVGSGQINMDHAMFKLLNECDKRLNEAWHLKPQDMFGWGENAGGGGGGGPGMPPSISLSSSSSDGGNSTFICMDSAVIWNRGAGRDDGGSIDDDVGEDGEDCFLCMYGNHMHDTELSPPLKAIYKLFEQNYGKINNKTLCSMIHKHFLYKIYQPAVNMLGMKIPMLTTKKVHDHFFSHIIHPQIYIGEKINMYVAIQKTILKRTFYQENGLIKPDKRMIMNLNECDKRLNDTWHLNAKDMFGWDDDFQISPGNKSEIISINSIRMKAPQPRYHQPRLRLNQPPFKQRARP